MTQYNSLNVKLLNSQLNKLKSAIKNESEVVLRLSSNMIGNSDDETNFSHKLLLTNRQVANLRKVFANHLSTDIKLSKTQLYKMIQSKRLLGPLLKTGLLLIKSVIKSLAKSVLIPLGLTAVASQADAGIHKKILGSGNNTTTLIISNNEMEDIIKTIKSLEDSGLLLKGVTDTVQNEVKEQKGGFLSMLLGRLGASLLKNILAGKGAIAMSQGRGVNKKGKGIVRAGEGATKSNRQGRGIVRAGYGNKKGQKNNVINLHENSDIGTHWIALYVVKNNVTYFDSFGVEHISKEIKKSIDRPLSSASRNKNIKANIFRTQAYDSLL